MKDVIIIEGGALIDQCFSVTTPDEVEVVWNVSKIQRAADAGLFGPAVEMEMSVMPPPRYDLGFLDREKVCRMKLLPVILDMPALAIAAPRQNHILCFCDGQHRLTARYELQLSTFSTLIVPTELEKQFRITERRGTL